MPPNTRMLVAGAPTTPARSGLPANFSAAHSTSRRQTLKLVIGAGLPLLFHGQAAKAATTDMPASPLELASGGDAEVSEVIDGDTLRLADGRELRLVGIQAPKLPLGRPNFPTWPLAEEAKAALAELANGRIRLYYGGAERDRYGRALAHIVDATGRWIQGAMIERGMARTYSFVDNRSLVHELLRLEAAARQAGRGIWALSWYRVRGPEEVAADLDSFQLVEGRPLAVAERRSQSYVNFGVDWKTDFTLWADASAQRLCERDGLPLKTLEGRRIRARGWIESFNGPEIEITHPEQIEVLE